MIFKSVKNSEYESKKKKKIPIVISTIFHFCFHGIYSLLPTNIFFVKEYFFSYLVARGWENLKFFWGASVLGAPSFLFGRGGARPFSSIKP